MKLCDFINHALWRAVNCPELVRVIHYKIGEVFDFSACVEEYGSYHSEINVYYMCDIISDFYNLNICCTWYDEEKILHIVVEL